MDERFPPPGRLRAAGPYPAARLGEVVEVLHGERVADPYRWLEDGDDPETVAWVAAQQALTEETLSGVSAREEIRARLAELWDYPRWGVPVERGGRYFQFRNSGLQDQAALFVSDVPLGEGEVLLDPNTLSADGTVAVSGLAICEDASLVAYATSEGGSDWMTWQVRDVESKLDLPDLLEWSKFSGAAWRKDGSGFYYGAMDPPSAGAEGSGRTGPLKVAFHRIGSGQREDQIVYEAPEEPEWLPTAEVTDDGRYLVVSVSRGTFPENQLQVLDLERPELGLRSVVSDFASKVTVVASRGSELFLLTDHGAERQRVVVTDLALPEAGRAGWREVLPEREDVLLEVRHCGGRLVCHYLHHAHSLLRVHELDGSFVREIPLPGIGSLAGLEGRAGSRVVRFGFTSFAESGSIWSHDLDSGETALLRASAAGVEPGGLVTELDFATSDDGTSVPLFLTRRSDVLPDGDVPVLLYGYGGFEVPMTPWFSVAHAAWMERGGLLAVAVLRGGGEYGRSWYEAGRLGAKTNVFDDFCACARHLVTSGWSRRERVAANGASNGGLLVGASITRHPELFGAAVAEVGVLDLLRFHKFTIGWAWKSDFGDPDDPLQYPWPRSYSPLHHVVPGTCYPPTMLLTGDHDDRVVPAHSLKFAAALQAAQACDSPVLLRVEPSAGHGAGKPTSKSISERADVLAFLDATVAAGRPRLAPRRGG